MNAKNTSSFEHELPELEKREKIEITSNRERDKLPSAPAITPAKAMLIAGGIVIILFLVWSFLHRSSKTPPEESTAFSSSLESYPNTPKEETPLSPEKPAEVLESKDEGVKDLVEQDYLKLQEEVKRQEERLHALETDSRLAALQNELEVLKQKDSSALKSDILKQVDRRFSVIEGELSKLSQARTASLSDLPFKVVAVDLWDGRPYVAVSVENKTKLVGVGDVVMGWEVRDIQFQKQQALFQKDTVQKEVVVQ